MKIKYFSLILYLLIPNFSYCQIRFDYKKERHSFNISVINTKQKNKIVRKKINNTESFESEYLGKIKLVNGNQYYLVSSIFLFDLKRSEKAEYQIFIYNTSKKFIGYYYLSTSGQHPKALRHNILFFESTECKNKVKVSFNKGIPRAMNLNCNEQNDFYEFIPN